LLRIGKFNSLIKNCTFIRMEKDNYFLKNFTSHDGKILAIHHWPVEKPKLLIHLVHGMSEHGYRYHEFSKWLNKKGIYAYAPDLRGHGKTAGSVENIGLFSIKNGWNKVVKDLKMITEDFSFKNPNIPTVILGHSMGSFLTRSLLIDFPETLSHYIFSATASHPGLKGYLGSFVAKSNSFLFGKKTKSRLLQLLVMGEFNKKIKKPKTRKDWLSRDESVVKQYINDPYCMQVFKNQFFVDLAFGVMSVNETKNIIRMNKDKHYLLFSGSMDPIGNYGKGVQKLYKKFIDTGLKNTEIKLFDQGRHEMLNEINKQEVYQYIYNWIDKKILNGK